jgi:hypothetical protein
VLVAVSVAASGVGHTSATPGRRSVHRASTTRSVRNPIPPRLQWNENYGYCGEVAFISAGIYYGQYLSQYDARAIASNNTPQNEASSQLLLGVNDAHAASQMHFTYVDREPGAGATTTSFLAWVKSEVIRGYPVAIGVYTNESLFDGSSNPNAGDPEYDHIVTVTGITSDYQLTLPAVYHANDVITFLDDGLWTGPPNGKPQYSFSYPFGSFQATRQQANAKTGNVYSLADAVPDFGIAITGIADKDHETVPVRVTTNLNYESPQIANKSNVRPPPMTLILTVTVSGLHPGVVYHLYRYDSMASVPDSAFNLHGSVASEVWTFIATETSYTLIQTIRSRDEVVYRAVPASAP